MKSLSFFKLAGIVVIVLCITSCEKDLNVPIYNSYTDENFWKSKEEVEAGINGCYQVLDAGGLFTVNTTGNIMSETFTSNAFGGGPSLPFSNGTLGPDNVNLLGQKWTAAYRGIGRVNTVLDNFTKAGLEPKEQDEIEGQALFLRALFYENLVFYFGGVPLILQKPDLETQGKLPRSPMNEVVEQILKDLDIAIQKLPVSYKANSIGRATKGAALTLKAQVLLYYASPLFNPENDQSRWIKAAEAAKDVINLAPTAGYDLFPNYRELFLENNENNKEVIFDVQHSTPRVPSSADIILELQQNIAPLLGLVNSYYMIDGMSIENSPLYDPAKPYENRDPRLSQTIAVPGSKFVGKIANTTLYNITGFVFKKNTDYEDNLTYSNYPIRESGLNLILMRYADVLLMYAEAQNEVVGPDNSVYEVLNKIRDRVRMPHITTGLSKDEMRGEIRHERRIELAGEGLYYMDVRRWKIADKDLDGPVYNSDSEVIQDRKFVDKEYWWPIPTTILERNSALEQTSGY
jgi:hypothetical protein